MSAKSSPSFTPIDFDIAQRVVNEHATERNVPNPVYPRDVIPLKQPAEQGRGAEPAKPERTPARKFTVELPDYVIHAVQQRALNADPKTTAKYVVLEALQKLGIEIKPCDLVADARRTA